MSSSVKFFRLVRLFYWKHKWTMSGHKDEHVIYDVSVSHAATAPNVSDATTVISCGDRDPWLTASNVSDATAVISCGDRYGIRKYLQNAVATCHLPPATAFVPVAAFLLLGPRGRGGSFLLDLVRASIFVR